MKFSTWPIDDFDALRANSNCVDELTETIFAIDKNGTYRVRWQRIVGHKGTKGIR